MSIDLVAEKANTKAHLRRLAGGRVHEEAIPDDVQAAFDGNGDLRPFLLITWGTPYPTYRDRSIMGEEMQPFLVPMHVQAFASTVDEKNVLAGAVRNELLGWVPNPPNSSEYTFRGGGEFNNRVSSVRPTRFVELVNFELMVNLSTTPRA
jgi:hypothetical protein